MYKILLALYVALLFPVSNLAAQSQSEMRGFPVSRVIAEKATLRASPADSAAPVMEIFRGTMFPIDGQSGDWYRVVTRSGGRAWIQKEMLRPIEEIVPERPSDNQFTVQRGSGDRMHVPPKSYEERLSAMEARVLKLEKTVAELETANRSRP